MSRRRVVVTGLGCISPVGNTVDHAWANLLAGKSGIGTITRFDASGINCHFAGEVKDLDLDQYIAPKEARAMDKRRASNPHWGCDWFWHRRFAADRRHAQRVVGQRPTSYFALLCASIHHQHDFRSCVHAIWLQGPEFGCGHCLHHGLAQHW